MKFLNNYVKNIMNQIDQTKYVVQVNTLTQNRNFIEMSITPRPPHEVVDIFTFMTENFPAIGQLLESIHEANYKLNARMEVSFIKLNSEGEVEKRIRTWLVTHAVDPQNDYERLMNLFAMDISKDFEIFKSEASGWTFEKMYQFDINRARYKIGSHLGQKLIPPQLPISIPKTSVLSLHRNNCAMRNIGENCFVDAVTIGALIAILKDNHTFKMPKHSSRPYEWKKLIEKKNVSLVFNHKLNNLDSGVDINDIYLFENDNPSFLVNVLAIDGATKLYALRKIKYSRYDELKNLGSNPLIINLLLYKKHYYTVLNFDRLISGVNFGDSEARTYNHKYFFCYICLSRFRHEPLRDQHMERCNMNLTRRIIRALVSHPAQQAWPRAL